MTTKAERINFLDRAIAAFTGVDARLAAKAGELKAKLEAEPTEVELIAEAGKLNNHPDLVTQDHVSIMGMMDRADMIRHVAKLHARVSA